MHQLFITGDGSHSVVQTDGNVSYHSRHGAVTESTHIYINSGLSSVAANSDQIHILELGFGTGLNCLLTLISAERDSLNVTYETFETHPLQPSCTQLLNYTTALSRPDLQHVFNEIHSCAWNKQVRLNDRFTVQKQATDITKATPASTYNLVYWDAFDPEYQPELWTTELFSRVRTHLVPGSILVTYCSKSSVRRNLKAAGFDVEKIPGPHGKREITRATAI